jgi:predicted MPP superfamily phosphohydrolase
VNWLVLALVAALLWWGFDHALTGWTRLGRVAAWVVHVLLGLVLAGSLWAISWGRGLDDIQRWRPLTTSFLITLAGLLYLGLGLAALALINGIWRLVEVIRDAGGRDRTDRSRSRRPAGQSRRSPKPVTARTRFLGWAVPVVLVAATVTTAFGWASARQPAVNPVTVVASDLPSQFDGLRIALISDIHLGPSISGQFVADLVDQVNAAEPDLIVIAGDLVDGTVEQLGPELESLARLEAPYGTVLTTGNHEFMTADVNRWIDFWRSQGITVLDNSAIQLTRQSASIDIIGINDRRGRDSHPADLVAAVTTLRDAFGTPLDGSVDGTNRFRLLVAHQPVQATAHDNQAAQLGVDLQLSGHTHGGQLWPGQFLVRLQQPVVDGVHEVGGIQVVTSRGVGSWGPPVRVLAPPEIVLVTLRSQ